MYLKINDIWSHLTKYFDVDYEPVGKPRPIPPILLKSVFTSDLFIHQEIEEVFLGLMRDDKSVRSMYLRVYIDGMLSPKDEDSIFISPLHYREELITWLHRVFEKKNFGIIVNAVDRWSDSLSRKVAEIFTPLTHLWGVPQTSIETTLFIGNYGYTPFGIHIDDPYTTVFHFHLGPCTKRMTLFSQQLFHQLNGPGERCYDPDNIVRYGQSFDIEAGDVFMLPAHYYHVGFTEDLSIGIAVAVSRLPAEIVHSRAVNRAVGLKEFKVIANEVLSDRTKSLVAQNSVADWLNEIFVEYVAAERSSRSLRYSPQRKQSIVSSESEIQLDSDFPLEVSSNSEKLIVFVRGNRISLNYHPVLNEILCVLKSGKRMKVRALQDRFKDSIEPTAIEKVLIEIDSCGGLRVWNNDSSKI